ncbi:uncharacterized protein K452DRAFT_348209 [Aplosporella prunicola CBS 121167]|uniref:Zinc transporter n=1 Tax=Aplosporella prunicola CBS 121167 TaxID=1176127 RepID=A0A6A6BTT8_9PEZI|nr:uncharacterized protein K452DRAFT_348209 [Aplosporella prunicola CBS 121167]KAF2147532.1 hypothetical protein K452DRAFT_348209 [Aplosporella prunicola CBS 121167]
MASTYALPLDSTLRSHSQHGHGHAHSPHTYARSLLPDRSSSWATDSGLKMHDSPRSHSLSPHVDYSAYSIMKGRPKIRPRGESDLGRPAPKPHPHVASSYGFPAPLEHPENHSHGHKLQDALTGLLVPLPYILASLAFATSATSTSSAAAASASPLERLQASVSTEQLVTTIVQEPHSAALLEACLLSSGTLMLVASMAKLRPSAQVLNRRKSLGTPILKSEPLLTFSRLREAVGRIVRVSLPFYAAAQLGGIRTGLIFLGALACGLGVPDVNSGKRKLLDPFRRAFREKKYFCLYLALSLVCDMLGFTSTRSLHHTMAGYFTLLVSLFLMPPPFSTSHKPLATSPPNALNPSVSSFLSPLIESPLKTPSATQDVKPYITASSLIASSEDTSTTFLAGAVLSAFTILTLFFASTTPSFTTFSTFFSVLSMFSAAAVYFSAHPPTLQSSQSPGTVTGCGLTAIAGSLLHPGAWAYTLIDFLMSVFTYAIVRYELGSASATADHDHDHHDHHNHKGHDHSHAHSHAHDRQSRITRHLLSKCDPDSITYSILLEKDSRRIAYFTCLNLFFMLVQFFYGYVSGSLGLLSDSIHMLFDCAGLAVGLAAAVMAKWPASARFPYGYGKVELLSGFSNGIFLLLVSIEICLDAFERFWEGHELRRLNELLVVSVLGFLVNMVGLAAMGGHAHHGHGHDHHHHGDENMHGIFLHVMADALGSVAVIVSTILTQWNGWNGWDPLASCAISVMIFISALPLTYGAAMRLILCVPENKEDMLKDTLRDINSIRGVVNYSAPRFWMEDVGTAHQREHEHSHGHDHSHDHGNDHGHNHSHDHSHDHKHGHEHSHDHSHDHSHGDGCAHGHDHSHSHDHGHTHSHSNDHGHSHSHSHDHDHDHDHHEAEPRVLGVIHIIAAKTADAEDVRQRTTTFLKERKLDVLVHVEKEGDRCWCGGGANFQ